MEFRLAQPQETETVIEFYRKAIEDMAGLPYMPKWQLGVNPTEAGLGGAISRGELYLVERDGAPVGAVILNHECDSAYKRVEWGIEAEPGQVTVLHTLCVTPKEQRKGIGGFLIQNVLRRARELGQKTVRLDVLGTSLPPQKMYRSAGFAHRATLTLCYEDTGPADFLLFEYVLDTPGL